jgi:hypothetical protein
MLVPELQAGPPPENLTTLLWIMVGALVSVVIYLYRQLRIVEDRNAETQRELLEKVLTGLNETNIAISGLVDVIGAYQQQFSIMKEIETLREELRHGKDT